ncbi:MAG TPA: S1/P1 Nuclease, partial [Brevundimonas sp.]|nr:S1/P1 Nuclease [Brevundimonas sp.]
PFYQLEKAGGFAEGDARGADFVIARLAAGASELRDLFILAWRDSADDEIGWPKVKVAEVEAGTADPWLAMYGED